VLLVLATFCVFAAEAYTVTPSVVSPQLVSLSGSFSSDGSILEFAQGFAATVRPMRARNAARPQLT